MQKTTLSVFLCHPFLVTKFRMTKEWVAKITKDEIRNDIIRNDWINYDKKNEKNTNDKMWRLPSSCVNKGVLIGEAGKLAVKRMTCIIGYSQNVNLMNYIIIIWIKVSGQNVWSKFFLRCPSLKMLIR